MNKLKFLPILIFSAVMIFSCSDNGSTDPNGDNTFTYQNLFPMDPDRYWIGERYELDSNNNRVSSEPMFEDSTYISGQEEKTGKIAAIFTTKQLDVNTESSRCHFKDGDSIFLHSEFFNEFINLENLPGNIELPINITDQWLLIFDPSRNSWDIFDELFDNVKFYAEFVQDTLTLNGHLAASGKVAGVDEVEFEGSKLKALKVTINLQSVDMTISIGSYPVEATLSRDYHIWYADQIGIVKEQLESLTVDIPSVMENQKLPGYDWEMTDYSPRVSY